MLLMFVFFYIWYSSAIVSLLFLFECKTNDVCITISCRWSPPNLLQTIIVFSIILCSSDDGYLTLCKVQYKVFTLTHLLWCWHYIKFRHFVICKIFFLKGHCSAQRLVNFSNRCGVILSVCVSLQPSWEQTAHNPPHVWAPRHALSCRHPWNTLHLFSNMLLASSSKEWYWNFSSCPTDFTVLHIVPPTQKKKKTHSKVMLSLWSIPPYTINSLISIQWLWINIISLSKFVCLLSYIKSTGTCHLICYIYLCNMAVFCGRLRAK